jgi:DNA-binding transcriptional regulator YdaS (Cro superfamily)
MTPKQKEAWDLQLQGMSGRAIARHLGVAENSIRQRLKGARKHAEADGAIQGAMSSVGMKDAGPLHSGWIKSEGASLYFQMPRDAEANVSEIVREAFEDIPACPAIPSPREFTSGLLTVYPIFDAHIGMRASADESGEDMDNDIAERRITGGVGQCIASSPASEKAVILIGGDALHANDQTAQTPQSKHVLDVASSFSEALDVAIRTFAACVEMAAVKHNSVIVSVIQGNHDRDAFLAIMYALRERYRDNPRIEVQRKGGEFFVMEWGKVMIASHHGDKAKAEKLVMHMADEWSEMWGRTRYRFYFTGHMHHTKMQDIGGVQVEQLRAVAPRDAYAASHSYSSRSEMQAITYHKDSGEVSRVKVALG